MLCVCGLERDASRTLLLLHLPASGNEIYRVTPFGKAESRGWLDRKERGQSLVCSFWSSVVVLPFSWVLPSTRTILVGNSWERTRHYNMCLEFWACTFLCYGDWAHLLLFCLRCRFKESDQKSQRSSERIRDCGAKLAVALILVCLYIGVECCYVKMLFVSGRIIYFLERGLEFVEWITWQAPRLELAF